MRESWKARTSVEKEPARARERESEGVIERERKRGGEGERERESARERERERERVRPLWVYQPSRAPPERSVGKDFVFNRSMCAPLP